MKTSKTLFVVAAIAIIGGMNSCEATDYFVVVTNNSSKSVAFSYDDASHNLPPAVSETYQVKAHTQPPQNITVPGAMSVSMTAVNAGNGYLFEDKSVIEIHVLNFLSFDVRIAEKGNCIEDSNDNPFIECNKLAVTASIGRIYTKSPDFYSLPKVSSRDEYSQHPVNFEYDISDDGKMFVTIK